MGSQREHERARARAERAGAGQVQTYFPVVMKRERIANGGWEWWLVVGDRRVGGAVGIFTDADAKPELMLARLLQRAVNGERTEAP